MSAPRKKLSGAENRKRAKDKIEGGMNLASKMRKWLIEAGGSSSSTHTSGTMSGISSNSCILDTQVNSTDQSKRQSSGDGEQFSPSVLSQQEDDIQIVSSDLQQSSSKDKIIDVIDPGTWSGHEKITDQQRSFLSKQAILLNNEHPNNIEFKYTERNGRHLTHSMWFGKMANNESIKRSWLVYSKTKNALYCSACKLFDSTSISALCKDGLTNWKKTSEKLYEHEVSQAHKECLFKWKTRLQQMKSCQGIDRDVERLIHSEKEKWRHILHVVMDAVMYLATNCLSFRGSEETPSDLAESGPQPNQGNFLNLISLLAKYDHTLKYQLNHLKKGHVSYLSKTIQNEIIEIMANKVRNTILNEIKDANYFTIMFDCTPDVSHTEQMSQVIRYIKITETGCEIKESFIDFIEVDGKTGEYITQCILEKLEADGLEVQKCRGQSYDNGSNMAGIYKGVQSRVLQMNELAEFVPCLAHSLNLVGVHAASTCPQAVSLFGLVQKLYCFFVGSTTRWKIMQKCTKTNLKGSSQTRWSAKHQAVTALLNNLPEVVKTLEEIEESSLAAESKYEAGHLLHAVLDFKFILNLTIWDNILREINRVNVEIQKDDIIISRSVAIMQGLVKILQELREKPVEYWLKEATPVSEKLEIEPVLKNKRISKKKKQHDEICEDEIRMLDPTRLFFKDMKVVFDKIVTEIEARVESAKSLHEKFAFLSGHAFLNMSTEDLQKKGADLALKYSKDLNAVSFCQELAVFKELVHDINEKSSAFDLLQHLYKHDLKEAFPNVSIALRIYCTLPTTSASCERSFSKLKIIKTYLRSTMSQERLSGLAILAIENKTAYASDFEELIDSFAEKQARRVKL